MRATQPPLKHDQVLEHAVAMHRAGELDLAQRLYAYIIQQNPRHFDALHLLGVLRHQQGRNAEAHGLLSTAQRLNANSPELLSNLGVVLQELGRNEEAVAVYDSALGLRPRYADAHNNRGTALQALGRPAGAAMSFDRAIALRPDYADAHYNRASLMAEIGRAEDAIASFDQAIALRDNHFESQRGHARALRTLGRMQAALTSYNRAVALAPDDVDARLERGVVYSALGQHQSALTDYDAVLSKQADNLSALNNRGAALEALDRLDEAERSFAEALTLAPDDARLHANHGAALLKSKRYEEALVALDRALMLPGAAPNANTLNNHGNALQALQRYADALESYGRSLAIAPGNVQVLNNRGAALNELHLHLQALAGFDEAVASAPDYGEAYYNRGNALKALGRFAEARGSYEAALATGADLPYALSGYAECAAKTCDWKRTASIQRGLAASMKSGKSIISPFTLLGYDNTPTLQLACARTYAAWHFREKKTPLHAARGADHDRLRVAYLSANFNRHAMAYLMVGLFERHDRSSFEITGVSFGVDDESPIRERIVAGLDRFVDVRELGDREIAKLLLDLEIDIAVDIMGYTQHGRPGILSHRPAPVQVNYLGYPGTVGVDFIDYIMVDAVTVLPEDEAFYTEKVVRLPDCYQVTDRERQIAETAPTRQDAGLPERGFVFCCFNNNYKITAPVFDVWMRLLSSVEGSVLWLLGGDETVEANLRREAVARGVDPARLVFALRMEQGEHLARHQLADLFLDTLPYSAHTTCSDALWAGLPVLTCRGDTFAGRVAASILRAAGLPELVMTSLSEYEAMAKWLAEDAGLLDEIRQRLAQNRLTTPLFDTDLSRRHIEAAYRQMWRIYKWGGGPESFNVERCTDLTDAAATA